MSDFAAVPITMSKVAVGACLMRLARKEGTPAAALYAKIMRGWGHRIDRKYMTVKLIGEELDTFRSLELPPTLVECPRYIAIYRDPDNPDNEVKVRTQERPPKKRTFRTAGGRTRMIRVRAARVLLTAEGDTDMPKTVAKKKGKKKAQKTEELDELDELEGLEELDDLEDTEADEPDTEDDDEEDEAPAKKKRAKKSTKKKAKKAPVEEDEDEEDDDSDDDDEDDEEEAPKKRSKKSTSKKSAKKGKRQPPPTRELPAGKVGVDRIAELAKSDARSVRQVLRKIDGAEDKYKVDGRWAFTEAQAAKIAKKVKSA